MHHLSRRTPLTWLALPAAGCSLQPLAPLTGRPVAYDTPTAPVRPPAIGQHWQYSVFNVYNSQEIDRVRETITALTPQIVIERHSARNGTLAAEIQPSWGLVTQDPVWDTLQTYEAPLPAWPSSLQIEAREQLDTHYRPGTSSFRCWISVHSQVTAREQVRLTSGVFDCWRVDKHIRLTHADSTRLNFIRTDTLWLAPRIGRWVARQTNGEYWTAGHRPTQWREDHLRWELQSWA